MMRQHTIDLAWRIGLRFMWHHSNRFAKFVTWVSLIGLTLGVTILTVVVTVMNGFDRELKERLLDAVPHVTVQHADTDQIRRWITKTRGETHNETLADNPVHVITPYYRGFGALSSAGRVYPIGLYGVDPEETNGLPLLRASTISGELRDMPDHGIALSAPVARILRLNLGDPVLMMMVGTEGDRVRPVMHRFELSATFQLAAESDYTLAIINLHRFEPELWAQMGEYGVQIQLREPLLAPAFAAQLGQQADIQGASQPHIESWAGEFGELFRAVQLEKTMMFLILLLVVAIAAFNIVAGQTMVVNDKKAAIGILRTMGATGSSIRLMFLTQGIWISVVGSGVGLMLGVLGSLYINEILGLMETVTGMHLLDGSLFVTVPIDLQLTDLVTIGGLSSSLCLLCAYIPARRAAELDPVAHLH